MTRPVRVDRTAMANMASGHEPALLDDAEHVLAALQPLDPADADGIPPAVRFDPAAAGTARRSALPPPSPEPEPPVPGEVTAAPAADLTALVRSRVLTSDEVVGAFAEKIRRLNPQVRAFLTVTDPCAGDVAAVDGALAGVPVGLKDIIDTAGIATTCGSAILRDRVPDTDAESWRRLRDAGALLMGKLATQEFAAGVTGDNDHFGSARNPRHPEHVCGGSSSGSAVAVAAGMLPVALGTDTGGSIRIPAACCGVVGLKPTYGIVPIRGVYPLAWSLDHVGPLARTVRDAALVLDALAGSRVEAAARSGASAPAPLRVGVARAWVAEAAPIIQQAVDHAVDGLRRRGATVVDAAPPNPDLLTAINRVITYAEASAQHETMLRTGAAYGDAVRPRQEAGRFVLAGDYLTAQRLRGKACRAFAELWRDVDVLLTPTLPCTAPPVAATRVQVADRELPLGTALLRYTAPFNLTGTPAISIPYGRDERDLPIGLQLAAPAHGEDTLCHLAASLLP